MAGDSRSGNRCPARQTLTIFLPADLWPAHPRPSQPRWGRTNPSHSGIYCPRCDRIDPGGGAGHAQVRPAHRAKLKTSLRVGPRLKSRTPAIYRSSCSQSRERHPTGHRLDQRPNRFRPPGFDSAAQTRPLLTPQGSTAPKSRCPG